MTALGGSILSVSISSRIFQVASDADVTSKLGGFENKVVPNGNGTARIVKTKVPWSLEGVQIEVDDNRGDHEFLQGIADGNDYVPCNITMVSGITWTGDGIVTDTPGRSTQNATCGLSLAGRGKLEQQ